MNYSTYQLAFFDWIKKGKGNGLLEAVAGSGKTFTTVEALKFIPDNQKALFLAFNKSIATELEDKVPFNCQAKTLHSLGFSALLKTSKTKFTVRDSKTKDLIKAYIPEAVRKEYAFALANIIAKAKSVGLVPKNSTSEAKGLIEDTDEVWKDLIERYSISSPDAAVLIDCARNILNISIQNRSLIDFDDMIYFPAIFDCPFSKFDWVFVDEAQDLNPVQMYLLPKCVKSTGRIVAVGDSKQSIYGFRGAGTNSMQVLKETLNATSMRLSICYRCPIGHLELVKHIVPEIEAAPNAKIGEFRDLGDKWQHSSFTKHDLIISRTTAPLIRLAYNFIVNKIPVKVLGRDIGAGLIALIKKLDCETTTALYSKLCEWRDMEINRLRMINPEANTSFTEDKFEVLDIFIKMYPHQKPLDICGHIDSLFAESCHGAITLCTVHKAKGLERNRVFILNNAKLGSSAWAKRDWEKQQELNLQYVAYTRAKESLYFIELPKELA